MFKSNGEIIGSDVVRKTKMMFLVFNLLMYIIWLLLVVGMKVSSAQSLVPLVLHEIEAFYAAGLSGLTALAAFVVGYRVWRMLKSTMSIRRQLVTKMGFLAISLTIFFGIRCILIILMVFITDPYTSAILTFLGWGFIEFIPHLLMSILLHPTTNTEKQRLLNPA